MPFTTTNRALIVFSAVGTTWEVFDSNLDKAESGWDVLSVTYVKRFTNNVSAETVAADWDIGEQLTDFGDFWVVKIRPRCMGGGLWAADITAHGLAAARPLKLTGAGSVESQSADNTAVGGYAGTWSVSVLEAAPTIEAEYISTSPPETDLVGLEGTPPEVADYPVRDSFWDSLVDPTLNVPSGWVLMDLPWEKIAGADVWLIRERWQWRFEFAP